MTDQKNTLQTLEACTENMLADIKVMASSWKDRLMDLLDDIEDPTCIPQCFKAEKHYGDADVLYFFENPLDGDIIMVGIIYVDRDGKILRKMPDSLLLNDYRKCDDLNNNL
jgi:hypothetical protein